MKKIFYLFLLLMPFMAFSQTLTPPNQGGSYNCNGNYFYWDNANFWSPRIATAGEDATLNSPFPKLECILLKEDIEVGLLTISAEEVKFHLQGNEFKAKSIKYLPKSSASALIFLDTDPVEPDQIPTKVVFEDFFELTNKMQFLIKKSELVFGKEGGSETLIANNVDQLSVSDFVVHGNLKVTAFKVDIYKTLKIDGDFSIFNGVPPTTPVNGMVKFNEDAILFSCRKLDSKGTVEWGKKTVVAVEEFSCTQGTNPELDIDGEVYTKIKVSQNGESITIPYDEQPCNPEYDSRSKKDEFKVFADGAPVNVASIIRDANNYVLKLSKVIGQGQKVELSYKGGIVPDYSNLNERAVANIPTGEITNESTTILPTFASAELKITSPLAQTLEIEFSENLDSNSSPAEESFTLTVDGNEIKLEGDLTVSGKFVTIELNPMSDKLWPKENPQNLKLAYKQEGSPLKSTTTGASVSSFTDKPVKYTSELSAPKVASVDIQPDGKTIIVSFTDNIASVGSEIASAFSIDGTLDNIDIASVISDNGKLIITLNEPIHKKREENDFVIKYDNTVADAEIVADNNTLAGDFEVKSDNPIVHNNSKVGDVYYLDGTAKITFDGKYVLLTCDEPVKVKEDYKNNKDNWFLVTKKDGGTESYVKVVAITLHPYDNKTVVLHLKRAVPESEGKLYLAPYKEMRADGPIVSLLSGKPLRDWNNWILLERGEGVNPPAVPLSPIGIVSIFGLIALIGFIRYRR